MHRGILPLHGRDRHHGRHAAGLGDFAAIAAGGQATDSRTLDLSGKTPGTYYLGLVADQTGAVAEPVETDNVRFTALVVMPAADSRENNDTIAAASR